MSQSAPSPPAGRLHGRPPTGPASPSRAACPSPARWRAVLVGEYYNETPRARKIAFHCRNCRNRSTLFSSRSIVQESHPDRSKVSSRRRRAAGRQRRDDGPARRGLPACFAAAADGRKTAQMAHEAQSAQMALTALAARLGRRSFCRSTDGVGRAAAGPVRRYVVRHAGAEARAPDGVDGGRFERLGDFSRTPNGRHFVVRCHHGLDMAAVPGHSTPSTAAIFVSLRFMPYPVLARMARKRVTFWPH